MPVVNEPIQPSPTCATCRYWLQVEKDKGLCRRYPPVNVEVIPGMGKFPQCMGNWWCGEWKA